MADTMDGITEFEWLDPEEVHLVGDAASGFSTIVMKCIDEVTSEQARKEVPMKPPSLNEVLSTLSDAAKKFRENGERWKADELNREVAVTKLAHRIERGSRRFGPMGTPLLDEHQSRGTLPDDPTMGGI
jgi:hypothetical protein